MPKNRLMGWVVVAGLGLLACESSKPSTAFTPPALTVGSGIKPFHVAKDEVSTDKEKVDVRLGLAAQAEREEIDALMRDVYRQVMTRIGIEPANVDIYIYAADAQATAGGEDWVGHCRKHAGDLAPVFENRVPLTFPKAVEAALGKDTFVGKLQPKTEVDPATKHVTLTVPFVEPGKDAWAENVSYNTAVLTFTDYAQRLYQNVSDMDGFTFIGLWKDKEVVRIKLASKEDYNTLDLYALGERIGGKQGRAFAEAQLTKKSDATISKEKSAAERKEYQTALAKLPKGSVTISPALK